LYKERNDKEQVKEVLFRMIEGFSSIPFEGLSRDQRSYYKVILDKAIDVSGHIQQREVPLTILLEKFSSTNKPVDNVVYLTLLADVKEKVMDLDAAVELFKKALKIAIDSGSMEELYVFVQKCLLRLAEIYCRQGELEESRAAIRSLVKIHDEEPMEVDGLESDLSIFSFQLGHFELAIELATRELSNPDSSAVAPEVRAGIKNIIVQSLANSDKIQQAREKLKEFNGPVLAKSPHLLTSMAQISSVSGEIVCKVELRLLSPLPPSTTFFCSIDSPQEGEPPIVLEAPFGDTISFSTSLPIAKSTIVQIDAYFDSSKTTKLSTHLFMCKYEPSS